MISLTRLPEPADCDQAGRKILDRLRSSRAGVVLLSLKPLETVSSSVLGLLTALHERLQADSRQLWLCDLDPEVRLLLRVTKVDLLLRVFADEELAMQALSGETFSGFFRQAEPVAGETLRPVPAPPADIRLTAADLEALEDSDPEFDLSAGLELQPGDEESRLRRLADTASGFLRQPGALELRTDALPSPGSESTRAGEGESFLGTLFPESFPEFARTRRADEPPRTEPDLEPGAMPPSPAAVTIPEVPAQRSWSEPLPEAASVFQPRKSFRGWLMTVLIDLRVVVTLLAAAGVFWYFLYSSGQIGPEYYPLVAENLLEEYRQSTPGEPDSPKWQDFVASAYPRAERAVFALSRQGTGRTAADDEMLTAFKKLLDLTAYPEGNPALVHQIEVRITRARELNAPPVAGPDGQSQLD